MSFISLINTPVVGSEDLFIFNIEFLTSRAGKPFMRFDLGICPKDGLNILVRQMRVSGGIIRPPQVKVGHRKIDQALFGTLLARRLYELVRYTLANYGEPLELKNEKWATSRVKLKESKLENPLK